MRTLKIVLHTIADVFELTNEFNLRLMERVQYAKFIQGVCMRMMDANVDEKLINEMAAFSEKLTRDVFDSMHDNIREIIDGDMSVRHALMDHLSRLAAAGMRQAQHHDEVQVH